MIEEFDELLKLEEQFYKEGYEEAKNDSMMHNFLEGKQFGLQVGFQKFMLVGQITGICTVIESEYGDVEPLMKNVESVRHLIDTLKLDNNEESVKEYELTFKKLKNKFRVIMLALQRHTKKKVGSSLTFDQVEATTNLIANELKGFIDESETPNEQMTVQNTVPIW